jgi:hypothetical protein
MTVFLLNNGRKNEEDDETANSSIEQHIYVISIFRGIIDYLKFPKYF